MEAVAVTVNGDLTMEIAMECGSATVFILDSAGYEVITFDNVKVAGAVNNCTGGGSTTLPIYSSAPVNGPVATIER